MKLEDTTEALELLSSWGCKFEDTVFYEIYCKPNKNKIMKIEDLKGTKIYLSNVEDRRKFQEKLFKLGIKWGGVDCIVRYLEYRFYYIDKRLRLSTDPYENPFFFKKHKNKQVSLHDILSIEEPKVKFKAFDKVLMRDECDCNWLPTLYAYYNSGGSFNHVSISDVAYKHCIPYEGNEHLAGTTNSPN